MEFIYHVVNNSMVLLFFLKPFSRYGISPAVLRRLGCSVLSSKFDQNLTVIRRISEAMDYTVSRCALRAIHISFTALSSALIIFRVSILRGGFSSLIPNDSSTVGFCPSSFFIKCYHTLLNTFRYFHTLKHIYSLFREIVSQSKPCSYACFDHLSDILFNNILFNSVTPILSAMVAPGKEAKY